MNVKYYCTHYIFFLTALTNITYIIVIHFFLLRYMIIITKTNKKTFDHKKFLKKNKYFHYLSQQYLILTLKYMLDV